MRAQPGCGRLPSGARQGRGHTGLGQALRPLKHGCPADTPGDGAVQDSPLTDQNPHFSSAHSSGARRKDLEVSLSPHSVSGPERCWSSLPHFQTPCHFFLWVLPSCLSFPPVSYSYWNGHILRQHVASPHMSSFSAKAAFRSDTARDSTGLDLGSLAGGPTGLGTTGHTGPQIFS